MEESDEESTEENSKRQELLIQVTETAYETLGKAWPSNHVTQGKTVTRLCITDVFNAAALCPRCIFF